MATLLCSPNGHSASGSLFQLSLSPFSPPTQPLVSQQLCDMALRLAYIHFLQEEHCRKCSLGASGQSCVRAYYIHGLHSSHLILKGWHKKKRLHRLFSNAIYYFPSVIHLHYMYEVHLWTISSLPSHESVIHIISMFGFGVCFLKITRK